MHCFHTAASSVAGPVCGGREISFKVTHGESSPSMTDGRLKVVDSCLQLRHLLRLNLQVVDIPQARHQHLLRRFQFLQEALPDILSEITGYIH